MSNLQNDNIDRILNKIEDEKEKFSNDKISLSSFIFALEECIARLHNEQLIFEMEKIR